MTVADTNHPLSSPLGARKAPGGPKVPGFDQAVRLHEANRKDQR